MIHVCLQCSNFAKQHFYKVALEVILWKDAWPDDCPMCWEEQCTMLQPLDLLLPLVSPRHIAQAQ